MVARPKERAPDRMRRTRTSTHGPLTPASHPLPRPLDSLRLEDSEIEAVIEAPDQDVSRFREILAQVLAYGRPEALPTRVAV